MLNKDGEIYGYSANSSIKGGSLMKQLTLPSVYAAIVTLRTQLEDAFSRGDLTAAQKLSRQLDGIQLQQWLPALGQVS